MNEEETTPRREQNDHLSRFALPIALLILALQGLRTISHADFWSHLVAGRWIAQHGIPRVDPFTLVSENAAWVNGHWLYDTILYGLWQIGGAPLVTLVHVVLVLAAFFLLIRAVRSQASPTAIALALLLSGWLLAPRFEVGPPLLALFFPAFYLYFLSGTRSPWSPYAVLLPLQILWANLDVSFIWGPIIGLLFTLQAYFQNEHASRQGATLRLAGLTAALLLASVITPYGPAIYGSAIASWTAPFMRDWISPISPHFGSPLAGHLVTLALIIGAAGLLTRKARLPVALTAIAVLSAFLVVHSLALHITIFSLFAFPFFCLSLQSLGEFIRDRLPTRIPWAQQALTGIFTLLALISAFAILTNRYYVHTGNLSSFGVGAVTDAYPDAAKAVIERPDFPERLLNLPGDGGYLAWQHPDRRVFIDQRSTLHQRHHFDQLAQGLLGHTESWETLLSDWDPQAIILNNTWPQAADVLRHLSRQPAWETVYFDGTTTILVLGTSAHAGLLRDKRSLLQAGLERIEQERRTAQRQAGMLVRAPIPAALVGGAFIFQHRGYYREAAACYELLTTVAPGMRIAELNLGISLTRLGEHERAADVLDSAVTRFSRGSDPWVVAHLNKGISETELGRFAAAIRHLRIGVDAQPNNAIAWLWLSRAYTGAGQVTDARQALEQARSIDPDLTRAFQAE